MYWIVIEEQYLKYLREFEPRIPRTEYGEDKYKPFFGVLFETEDLCYVTQVSHPKPRHERLKSNIDFKKVYRSGKLVAVVNLNYMFPIPKKDIIKLDLKIIDKYRSFKSEEEKAKYISLLMVQIREINRMGLKKDAMKLYEIVNAKKIPALVKRSFDFKAIEARAKKYIHKKDKKKGTR